jgi:hypothetical protein
VKNNFPFIKKAFEGMEFNISFLPCKVVKVIPPLATGLPIYRVTAYCDKKSYIDINAVRYLAGAFLREKQKSYFNSNKMIVEVNLEVK